MRSNGSRRRSARAARRQLSGRSPKLRAAEVIAVAFLAFGCDPGPASRGPVVLVVVDTLRADHLGAYGHERATSPELDAWAEQGRLFERAWATSSWTLPSLASVLTGRSPARHGAVAMLPLPAESPLFGRLHESIPTLAERFREAGYATAAFVNNPYLTPLLGLDRGFDVYDHEIGSNRESRRAGDMVDRALAWLGAQGERPFFVLLHLLDPHMDYDAPSPHRGRFTAGSGSELRLPLRGLAQLRRGMRPRQAGGGALRPEDRRFVAAAYDEEVAYVDAELGRLRRALEARGVLGRGVVALVADHGEELFEHGGFEHGHALWEEVLRVPLVFWGRGVVPGREGAPVSLVDVAPTLLEAVGLDAPERLDGVSLWPNVSAGVALAERTLRFEDVLYGGDQRGAVRWPWKVVVLPGGEVRHWNLERDPGEQGAGEGPRPPAVAELAAELEGVRVEAEPRPVELDDATRERLRALGYLD